MLTHLNDDIDIYLHYVKILLHEIDTRRLWRRYVIYERLIDNKYVSIIDVNVRFTREHITVLQTSIVATHL